MYTLQAQEKTIIICMIRTLAKPRLRSSLVASALQAALRRQIKHVVNDFHCVSL